MDVWSTEAREPMDAEHGSHPNPDGIREAAVEQLNRAADFVHEAAAEGSALAGGYGQRAAGFLDQVAEYVHEFDPKAVSLRIQNEVRRRPERALLIAALAGFGLGVLFKRR
jgi:hypothetical protein